MYVLLVAKRPSGMASEFFHISLASCPLRIEPFLQLPDRKCPSLASAVIANVPVTVCRNYSKCPAQLPRLYLHPPPAHGSPIRQALFHHGPSSLCNTTLIWAPLAALPNHCPFANNDASRNNIVLPTANTRPHTLFSTLCCNRPLQYGDHHYQAPKMDAPASHSAIVWMQVKLPGTHSAGALFPLHSADAVRFFALPPLESTVECLVLVPTIRGPTRRRSAQYHYTTVHS